MPTTGDGTASHGWGRLLDALTEEELEQYGQLARDQIRGEYARVGVYVGLVAVSIGLTAAAIWMFHEGGYGWFCYFALGLGLVLLYWPYRAVMTCILWDKHYQAVRGELERRAEGNESSGD